MSATHVTSKDNVQLILDKGFTLDKAGKGAGGTFGKGVYFTQGKNEILYYKHYFDSDSEIKADIDTKGFLEVEFEGSQKSNQMYKTIVGKLTPNEQKEYRKQVKEIKDANKIGKTFVAYPEKKAVNDILAKNYPGLIVKQKSNGFDVITGGNQIVVYDLKRINIKK